MAVNIPASCLTRGGTCATASAQLKASVASDPAIQSASCVGSGTCVCTIVETPVRSVESGTYASSGSALTTNLTGATPGHLVVLRERDDDDPLELYRRHGWRDRPRGDEAVVARP